MNKEKLIRKLEQQQEQKKKEAYQVGYAGKRLRAFSTIGEDAEQEDIDRAIRVSIIDRDNEASPMLIDFAISMLRPVLGAYIQGLKDGCAEKGNYHLWDMGRRFREQVKKLKDGGEAN